MNTSFISRIAPSAALLLILGVPAAVSAQSAATVVVNGQTVAFDQPPVEQNGRLFVPLRGVFERLGASVVYSNGQIDATSGNTSIQLQVGSTQATVGGQPTALDAPPFLVGGRVLVPLRFISQALGASVNYVQSSDTVYVNEGGGHTAMSQSQHYGPPPDRPDVVVLGLGEMQPALGATVPRSRPEISASFEQMVEADSVRVALDGRDVTSMADVTQRGFSVRPNFDLAPGQHTVTLAGRIDHGSRFAAHWQFVTQPQ